jgi:PIN domain nuclease of toxin-antitoxin system
MIVLDTHAFIWMLSAPKNLGVKTRRELAKAADHETLSLCSCTWLELEMLVERRGAVARDMVVRALEFCKARNIAQLAVTTDLALCAAESCRQHGDPFDLMIAAAAIVAEATLVTADQILLDWPDRRLKRLDART